MKAYFIILFFFLISCSGENSSEHSEKQEALPESSSNSCLTEMVDSPGLLLTMEEAVKLTGQPEDALDQDVNTQYKNVRYEWNGGRKKELAIGKNKMEIDADDFIAVQLKPLTEKMLNPKWNKRNNPLTPREYFDKFHPGVSKDAKKALQEEIEKQNPDNAEGAKKIVGMMKFEGFLRYDDIGESAHSEVNASAEASAGMRQTELTFLHGDVIVLIVVDVSDEDEEDRKVAVELAKTVLKKCN